MRCSHIPRSSYALIETKRKRELCFVWLLCSCSSPAASSQCTEYNIRVLYLSCCTADLGCVCAHACAAVGDDDATKIFLLLSLLIQSSCFSSFWATYIKCTPTDGIRSRADEAISEWATRLYGFIHQYFQHLISSLSSRRSAFNNILLISKFMEQK